MTTASQALRRPAEDREEHGDEPEGADDALEHPDAVGDPAAEHHARDHADAVCREHPRDVALVQPGELVIVGVMKEYIANMPPKPTTPTSRASQTWTRRSACISVRMDSSPLGGWCGRKIAIATTVSAAMAPTRT